MKTKTRLTALIIATCLVVASSIGIIAWALAAANVGLNSTLSVTYEAAPHVVCTASATYQKTTDTSATAFQSGTIDMNYGDSSGSRTLNASNSALVLNDTNTYVVFEFTFTNNNKMDTMGINITLTDNGVCSNMIRKYYFGDLSSKTISEKESTIKSSGIKNSALSTKSVTLKQNKTTRIYMLLEITPGVKANYNSDATNKFLFTLTSVEVDPHATVVSYLSADWEDRILKVGGNSPQLIFNTDIIITSDKNKITNLTQLTSVGTNSLTSTDAYIANDEIEDVIAYVDENQTQLVFYSPVKIYAPENSKWLFRGTQQGITRRSRLFVFENFDTSKAKFFSFYDCRFSTQTLDLGNVDLSGWDNQYQYREIFMYDAPSKFILPYNVPTGVIIKIGFGNNGYYHFKDSNNNDCTEITSENCSTLTNKVTWTYSYEDDTFV